MKVLIFITTLFISLSAFTHVGHEMPTEPAKYGGVLGNVMEESKGHRHKGHDERPLLKAEVVRSEDGTIRLYVYDLKMNQLKADAFSKEARVTVDNRRAKTKDKFTLKAAGDHFIGTMPKQRKKPFDLYITLNRSTEHLFVAFDNLD